MEDEKFSAFIDDELSQSEFDEMCSRLFSGKDFSGKDKGLKQKWQRYHVISDTLQKHLPEKVDYNLADRVMSELENEPVILAPNRVLAPAQNTFQNNAPNNNVSPMPTPIFKQIAGLAVAASVMVVAILVSQSFTTQDGVNTTAPIAALPTMPSKQEFARVSKPQTILATQQAALVTQQTTALAKPQMVFPPDFQNQLNKYLANHNQYASGVSGVLPYARIIGYTPDRPQLGYAELSHSELSHSQKADK